MVSFNKYLSVPALSISHFVYALETFFMLDNVNMLCMRLDNVNMLCLESSHNKLSTLDAC